VEDMVFGRRYRVTEKIGSGGMAEVYKAVDEVLGRTVAIKVLHSHYSSDPAFVARFRQEAQAAANLSHPGIVNIYDWGQDGEAYYIVMEYVHGADLKELVTKKGPVDPAKVAEYASQVCAALSVAHGYDIIHRDIKPHNIVLTPSGSIKVMDFGIARAGNTQMTQTGSVLGTAHYVSPEQAQGKELTASSDLYSLGVVLYELATGRVPFDAETPVAVALKQVNEDPIPPRQINPSIPSGLEAIILRAMAKSPSERYFSAEEMRRDLSRVAAGRTIEPVIAENMMDATSVMPAVGASGQRPGNPRVRPVPSRRNPWPWIALVTVLLIIAFGTAWGLGAFQTTPMVVLPDLTGMTEQEVTDALEEIGLTVGTVTFEYSEEPSGTVLSQDPTAGTEVEVPSEVSVVFSQGSQRFAVPNLTDLSEAEALAELRKAGFELNTIQREYSDKPEGVVIRQVPAADTFEPQGALVTIVVSRGIELREIPPVTGMSQGDARRQLEAAGFKVKVVEEFSETVARGSVIGQSPDAGASLRVGAEVTIQVSKGKDLVRVPNVIGQREEQAITTLREQGFTVDVQEQVSPDDGIVLTQDPIPDFSAPRGSLVIIYVGVRP